MASFSSWDIEYYKTAAGSVPVAEFVDELAPQAKARFIRSLELLEQYGLLLREPWVKNIQSVPKLRELRFTSFGEIYRVFFFPVSGRKLILLHGFKKKIGGNAKAGAANRRSSHERLRSPARR